MKTIHVVAAIIHDKDRVFATQRGYGDYKDWWEFPGGKVEPGERPEDALVREIREELAAGIAVERFLTTVEYDYPAFHLSMDCFWCSLAQGHLTLLEHEAARWLPLDDLRQVNWLPADVLVIEAIERERQTLLFYEENAAQFAQGTMLADMEDARSRFLNCLHCLPAHAYLLDFGCGSGRDAKAFLEKGYRVDAVDGSLELCRIASEYAGIPVRHMLFQELSAREQYDGIWACASILHLPKRELSAVLLKIAAALKPGGVLYTSFKYGTFAGMRGGRYFTDFTEETLVQFIGQIPELDLEPVDVWTTQDVRPGREEERWINILARRG